MASQPVIVAGIAFALLILGTGALPLSATGGDPTFDIAPGQSTDLKPGEKLHLATQTPDGKWTLTILDRTGAAACVIVEQYASTETCTREITWTGATPRLTLLVTLPTYISTASAGAWTARLTSSIGDSLSVIFTARAGGTAPAPTTTATPTSTTPPADDTSSTAEAPTETATLEIATTSPFMTIVIAILATAAIGIAWAIIPQPAARIFAVAGIGIAAFLYLTGTYA